MRNFAVPHWVRCCGVAGSAVVIDDPSVDPALGESWVDGHLLPIPTAELDVMAAYGPSGYRARCCSPSTDPDRCPPPSIGLFELGALHLAPTAASSGRRR